MIGHESLSLLLRFARKCQSVRELDSLFCFDKQNMFRLLILVISHKRKSPKSDAFGVCVLWRWRSRSQIFCSSSLTKFRDPASLFCFAKQNMFRPSILDARRAGALLHLHKIQKTQLVGVGFFVFCGDGENRTRVQKMFSLESTKHILFYFPEGNLNSMCIKQATPHTIGSLCFAVVSRRSRLLSRNLYHPAFVSEV